MIIARLLTLQVITSKYRILADDQGIFRKVVYPDRGIVYDRKGKAILQNTIIYDLMVIPGKIRGTDTAALCNILGIDTADFRKRIISAIIKNKSYRPSVFEPLLTDEKMACWMKTCTSLPRVVFCRKGQCGIIHLMRAVISWGTYRKLTAIFSNDIPMKVTSRAIMPVRRALNGRMKRCWWGSVELNFIKG